MPEFNFSKIEDQKKFEKLLEKDREEVIDDAHEEALRVREMVNQQKVTDYESATRQINARKHWKRGHLGVTAEDHLAFGGSPDFELNKNRGKTLGELWSIEKILEHLNKLVDFLEKARKEYKEKGPHHPDIRWSRDDILYAKNELKVSISYLKSIGKLPREFENFWVEDLKDDPSGNLPSAF